MSLHGMFCLWGRSFSRFRRSCRHSQTFPIISHLSPCSCCLLLPTLPDLTVLRLPPAPGHVPVLSCWPERPSLGSSHGRLLIVQVSARMLPMAFPDHPPPRNKPHPSTLCSRLVCNGLCRYIGVILQVEPLPHS